MAHNVPFIQAVDWTFGSPDLSPLDYELWNILELNACRKHHPNLELLKRNIIGEAAIIPLEMIGKSIAR